MDPVVPGDRLGAAEQYLPGEGTYLRAGSIYACLLGLSWTRDYKICIQPLKPLPMLKPGDQVIGAVINLSHPLAMVRIGASLSLGRSIPECLGVIHVLNLGMGRIKIDQGLGLNDILRAMVIDPEPLRLSLKSPELGVIKAFCPSCHTSLSRRGSRLRCARCHKLYRRKISSEYGKGIAWSF